MKFFLTFAFVFLSITSSYAGKFFISVDPKEGSYIEKIDTTGAGVSNGLFFGATHVTIKRNNGRTYKVTLDELDVAEKSCLETMRSFQSGNHWNFSSYKLQLTFNGKKSFDGTTYGIDSIVECSITTKP